MMHPLRTTVALLGGMIAVRPAGAQAPAAPAAFVVAVSEGETLLPLARFEGGRWLNTWPEPEEDSRPVPALADVPAAWLGRPVPLDWTLWFTGGGTVPLQIAGTARSGGCVVSPKLTIRNPQEPRDGAFDVVHPGLATTDGAAVGTVHLVTRRTAPGPRSTDPLLMRRLQPLVQSLFAAHQRGALDRFRDSDGRPAAKVTPRQLEAISPTIDWVYRARRAGGTVLYFEASKRTTPTATERMTVRGWLRLDTSGGAVSIGVEAHLGLDEEPPSEDPLTNVSDQIPLGIIRSGEHDVWIMELPAGESTDFALDEIGATSARRVMRINAGGC